MSVSPGNRNPEVDAWFEGYDNPQAPLVQQVRTLILEASPEVTEAIKWQAPTFVYRGNIASFYPKSKKHVSLMFHQGASLPDPAGLLEGSGDTSRVAKFLDAGDLAAKADALQELIRAWVTAHSLPIPALARRRRGAPHTRRPTDSARSQPGTAPAAHLHLAAKIAP